MDLTSLKQIKLACLTDLNFFIRYIFKEYYGLTWVHNWHHDEIIKLIYRIEARECSNAVVNIPPRYGKTQILVIIWMVWTFIRNPKAQFIHTSYSEELALKNSAEVRDILKHECIQRFFPLKMRESQDSKGLWVLEGGTGGLKAGSSYSAVTGFGAGITGWEWDKGAPFDGCIISDDPLKPLDARSEAARASVNANFSTTLHSRRNHRAVPIIIIMQRLHVDDPSGLALNGGIMGDKFEHLKLAAIQPGNVPLWPYKHKIEHLEKMRASGDPAVFAAQYMQEPYIADGEVYDLSHCGRYIRLPEQRNMRVHSWDTAYKAGTHNDPSCCTIWDSTDNLHYLADCVHGKWEYPELRRRVFELAERDNPDAILIEDKASGQSLIQELRINTNHPVIPIKPETDKETRARTTAAIIEAGRVMLPERAGWLAEFEAELVAFPNGWHDDRVDSVSMYLRYMRDRGSPKSFEKMLDSLGY